jgi:YD repeat-containing protein
MSRGKTRSWCLLLAVVLVSGLAHAQTVTLSPTSLSFGNQVIATTSTAKAITLTNGQSVALSISSIAVSGDYAQANNCGSSLGAGATCTIGITFTPTTTGTRTGTLSVTDSASNSPQTASLTGTGVLPATLTPSSEAFSYVVVANTSAAKNVTLKNNQKTALTITSVATTGDYAQTNNCGGSLPAASSCTIGVTFTPTTTGSRTGTLTVTDNASNSPQTTSLTGTGIVAPVLTGLSPTMAPVGTTVTISGTGFEAIQSTSTVAFNGVTATAKTWSATSITASVPTGATTGNVVVTVAGTSSNGAIFTVGNAPTITSLLPSSGQVGTAVTINGTGLGNIQGGSTVTFNGILAPVTSWSPTSIGVTVPTGATTGNIIVTIGGVATNAMPFVVTPTAPNIANIIPATSAVGAGVTIYGAKFGATQGTSTITFNGAPAVATYWSSQEIIAEVPSGATTGNVVINVGGVASNGFSFTVSSGAAPYISSLGSGDQSITVGDMESVFGNNFGTTQGSSTLTLAGNPITVSNWSATGISFEVPINASTGNLVATVNGVASNPAFVTVTTNPGIESMSPTAGPPVNTTVTINGANFGQTKGSSQVWFNGKLATPATWGPNLVTVPVPSGASTGPVTMKVGGIYADGSQTFTIAPATITSLSATSGPVGLPVTITGTNFTSQTGLLASVFFNGTPATITGWTQTTLTTTVPVGATTGNVVVTVAGLASNGVPFTVTPGPGITSIYPSSGPPAGLVSILGDGFGTNRGQVTFNGANANPTNWTPTEIDLPVPTNATSGNVVVTAGGTASNGVAFTVITAPTINNLSVSEGPIGFPVTITGFNFGPSQNGGSVTFNNVQAGINSWGPNSISVTVPIGATTGNVVVKAGGVASNGMSFFVGNWVGVFTISPTVGPVATLVTITGTNFGSIQGSSSVTFNGTGGNVQTWGPSQITVLVPVGATTGSLQVVVPGISTQYAVSNFYTVDSAPTIASLSPPSGPIGAPITIVGGNFDTNPYQSTVTFNGIPTYYFLSWSPSSIGVYVPTGTTTGNVVVTVGGIASNSSTFTVTPGPGISNVFNGITTLNSAAVGSTVSISGAGFGPTQGSSSVTFNGVPVTQINSWSDGVINGVVPVGATSGNLLVTVGGIASNSVNFTIVQSAQVTSVSPTSGAGGAPITIQGSGFGATQVVGGESSRIYLTGPGVNLSVNPTNWSDTLITGNLATFSSIVPLTGNISVESAVSGVSGPGVPFTLLANTYVSLAMSPIQGPTGTSVTLIPSAVGGFGVSQGSSTVTLSGVTAIPTSWNDDSIVVPVPAAGFTGPWVVTVNGVAMSSANPDKFLVNPTITGISPSSGIATTPVTIAGSGFGPSPGSATFSCSSCGGTVVSHTQSWTTNSIIALVPNLATTGPVTVTSDGTSNGVTFTVPTGTGSASGVVTSTIGGAGIGGAVVTALQGGVTIASTTTGQGGTYLFSSLVAGTYDIQFSASGYVGADLSGNVISVGTGTTVNVALAPTPIITSLSQTWGTAGTNITVYGSNFGGSQTLNSGSVSFNGVTANPATWSNASIVVPVPAGATTGPVIVTIAGAVSNSVNFSVGSGTLSGTVTSVANGAAIAGAQVEAMQSNVVVGSATTSSGGSYTISSISPGSYDLQGSASGFGSVVSAGNVVTVGSTTTVNLAMPAPAADSGTVTQSNGTTPIPGATVAALQNNVLAASTTTDSSGRFNMSNLSAGAYVIQAAAQGYDTQQQTATLTTGNSTTTNLSLTGQSTITYSYDQLGRLVGVVDSLNGAASYTYDAVGNVTSIGRQSISQVSLLSFSPISGTVLSTVTITGTDFSSTASQDTVSFNGTAGTIVSASPTQLVVTVPSGATTGIITVTAPGGSASSSTPFTVRASIAPTILSFSPSIGVVGTPIGISGTNFDATPSNNKVVLNKSQMTLANTSTTTNLSTSVPVNGVSSGRISVTTVGGQAVSTSDFYVIPTQYQSNGAGFTGRTQLNASPMSIALSTGQIGILLFDGLAGQSITGTTTQSSWYCGSLQGEFLNPDGSILNTNTCLGNQTFGPLLLPQTGTYSLVIFPAQSSGSVNVALNSVNPDITGTLYPTTTGSTLGPLTTQTSGQRYVFTLSGSAGSKISITSWGTYPANCPSATLFGPNGSQISGFNACMGNQSQSNPEFTGVITLPQTGSYKFIITPPLGVTGTLYLTSYSVPADPTVPLPMNGQATVTTTVPGQNGHFTFSLTSAQSVSMTFTAAASLNCEWWATLYSGSTQINQWQGCNNSTINTGQISLAAGSYSITIAPDSHDSWVVGSFTGTLQP